jgi:hypothetical protein
MTIKDMVKETNEIYEMVGRPDRPWLDYFKAVRKEYLSQSLEQTKGEIE